MVLEALQRAAARRLLALPEQVVRRLAGAPKIYRNATLDPRLQLALALATVARRPTLDSLSPTHARLEYRMLSRLFDIQELPIHQVTERELDGVPIRIYRPEPGKLPVLLFIHGGGFVIGDLDGYDRVCRYLARSARCAVVSVDYRLSPEHPFPAAVEDCFAVLEWLRRRGEELELDAERVAIAGDSAGGTLSAVVCQLVKDLEGPQPILQILIYPSTDAEPITDSRRELADGFALTASLISYFRGHYRAPPEDPRISPLRASSVRGVCPALIITCGFDPLLDEGRLYAEKLAAAGVPVTHRCHDAMIHGCLTMAGYVPGARVLLHELADALIRVFH